MRNLLPLFVLLALSYPAHAELYKWVDSSGKVHYSDQPPTGAKTQKVEGGKNKAAPAAAPAPKSLTDKELEFNKRRAEAKEAAAKKEKEAAEAAEKQQNCEQAREALRTLQTGGRITTATEGGERAIMGDAARQKAIEQAQKSVDSWCK